MNFFPEIFCRIKNRAAYFHVSRSLTATGKPECAYATIAELDQGSGMGMNVLLGGSEVCSDAGRDSGLRGHDCRLKKCRCGMVRDFIKRRRVGNQHDAKQQRLAAQHVQS